MVLPYRKIQRIFVLQKETKNPTIDRAKLQIKSEKPLFLEDFFRGSWSKSADTDTDSPKFRNPTIEGKRVKEKVYIYIYINIKIYY